MSSIAWVIRFCTVSYWELKVVVWCSTSAINLPGPAQIEKGIDPLTSTDVYLTSLLNIHDTLKKINGQSPFIFLVSIGK